jgi:hypothetical protein
MAHGSDRPLDIPDAVMKSPFASVIRRALAKPLEVRYQKASQMYADVQAVMALMEQVGEGAALASPDLETTQVIHSSEVEALRRRHNSKTSKKLRDAFNRLADKAATDKADDLRRLKIPEAPPTIPMMVDEEPPSSRPLGASPLIPPPAESLPILLTRERIDDPEEDTLRIRRRKIQKKKKKKKKEE